MKATKTPSIEVAMPQTDAWEARKQFVTQLKQITSRPATAAGLSASAVNDQDSLQHQQPRLESPSVAFTIPDMPDSIASQDDLSQLPVSVQ
jgi:hypothetical protein